MARRIEIYCPKCKWHPGEKDLWACRCGNLWNTFETSGNCPECGKSWPDTQCPSCLKWSPHNEWYHEFSPDEAVKEEVAIEKSTT